METLRAVIADPFLLLFACFLISLLGGAGGRRVHQVMERRRIAALVGELHDRLDGFELRLSRRVAREVGGANAAPQGLPAGLQGEFAKFARSLGFGPQAAPPIRDEVEGARAAQRIFGRDEKKHPPKETG